MKFIKSNLDPVIIVINEVEYPAKLTFRALAELEEITETTFMRLFSKMEGSNLTAEELIKMTYVSLKAGGLDITLDDLFDNDFNVKSTNNMMTQIGKLLTRTMKVVSILESEEAVDGDDDKKKM